MPGLWGSKPLELPAPLHPLQSSPEREDTGSQRDPLKAGEVLDISCDPAITRGRGCRNALPITQALTERDEPTLGRVRDKEDASKIKLKK